MPPAFQSPSIMRGTILRPLKNRDVVGFERLQVLLRSWCLRRTKDMRASDLLRWVKMVINNL